MKNNNLYIKFLSNFYLFLLIFYLSTLFLFSPHLIFFSNPISGLTGLAAHFIFVVFVLLLYLMVKWQYKLAFWMALLFHLFFFINLISILFLGAPLFFLKSIQLVKKSLIVNFILILGIGINVGIISSLIYKQKVFLRD